VHLIRKEGDEVQAGDALEAGARSHHRLPRVWGPERLGLHMLEELEIETARHALTVPRVYWALVVRAMLDWRRVLVPGDTGLGLRASSAGRARARAATADRGADHAGYRGDRAREGGDGGDVGLASRAASSVGGAFPTHLTPFI
jgi:hypothetical protein